VQRRIEANFGALQVIEASRRSLAGAGGGVARARFPLWRKPFLAKRALEIARKAGPRAAAPTPSIRNICCTGYCAMPRPAGRRVSRRSRHDVYAQIGLRTGGPHPVRLLLEAHGIGIDEVCGELDEAT